MASTIEPTELTSNPDAKQVFSLDRPEFFYQIVKQAVHLRIE